MSASFSSNTFQFSTGLLLKSLSIPETFIFSVLFVILFIALNGDASAQSKQDFTLSNQTGAAIQKLYVYPTASEEWGNDVLGKEVLMSGNDLPIVFNPINDVCLYDIKVTDTDGNATMWYGVDLCKYSTITLS
ncbi:MAG TPA: argininosuccinate lyase [Ignavibacteria bacterium]|nr:argininosuccinate lyase [Ignavibacteria bacterium]HMR39876.1 argininosuccinate lyase [Ignavibacteria bacterium]